MIIKKEQSSLAGDFDFENDYWLLNQYQNIFAFLEVVYQELYLCETQILILKTKG